MRNKGKCWRWAVSDDMIDMVEKKRPVLKIGAGMDT